METELSTPKTRRESEVWQACDDLWAQNASTRHLTGDNIRDQLLKLGYKRGSPNEIYRYRTSWRESRGISDFVDQAEGEVNSSDPISRAVSLVYDQMRTQTHEALDKITAEYEERLKSAQEREKSHTGTIAELTAQRDELLADLNSARQRGMQMEQEVNAARREHALMNERLKAAQEQISAARAEQERLVLELKTFHEREIDLWRSQTAELHAALAIQKKEARAELEKQGASLSDELMALKTELRQAHEDKAAAIAKLSAFEVMRGEQVCVQTTLENQRAEATIWQHRLERLLKQNVARQQVNKRHGRKAR